MGGKERPVEVNGMNTEWLVKVNGMKLVCCGRLLCRLLIGWAYLCFMRNEASQTLTHSECLICKSEGAGTKHEGVDWHVSEVWDGKNENKNSAKTGKQFCPREVAGGGCIQTRRGFQEPMQSRGWEVISDHHWPSWM